MKIALFSISILLAISSALLLFPKASSSLKDDRKALVLACPSGSLLEAIKPAIVKFETKHPGWKVKVISSGPKEHYVKSLSLLAAGNSLDVIWLGLGFGMFADRGVLLPVDNFIDHDANIDRSDFTDQSLAMYTLNGSLYGLPYGLDVLSLAINEDLFSKKGLPIPEDDWSFEEFLKIGRELSVNEPNRDKIYGLGMEEVPPGFLGMSLLSADGKQFGFDGPDGINWLNLNIELAREKVLLRSAGNGQLNRLNEFSSGRVGIMKVFSWEFEELGRISTFRWKLMPLPRNRKGNEVAWASSAGFSITGQTHHPREAWDFLKELTSGEIQRAQMGIKIPARKEILKEYKATLDPRLRAIVTTLSRLAPDPRVKNWKQMQSEWEYWSEKALQHQISPEEAIEISSKRINRILKDR